MREQRQEAMGGAPSEKPDDKDVIYAELDEDVIKPPSEEHPIKRLCPWRRHDPWGIRRSIGWGRLFNRTGLW